MKLYIDDIRIPKNSDFIIVRSSTEAINYMKKNGCPQYISFDHDLGGADTSMIVIKWMIETDLNEIEKGNKFFHYNFDYNIHSANPVGKENIDGYLKNYLKIKKIREEKNEN